MARIEKKDSFQKQWEALFGKTEKWKVRFKGRKLFFIGDKNKKDGSLASKEQYENFETSYAHSYPRGQVKRHGKVIGRFEDITFLKRENG